MTIVAPKMLFRQKLLRRLKALDLRASFAHGKEAMFAENVVVLRYNQLIEGR